MAKFNKVMVLTLVIVLIGLSLFAQKTEAGQDLLSNSNRSLCLIARGKKTEWQPQIEYKGGEASATLTFRAAFPIKDISQFSGLTLETPMNIYDGPSRINQHVMVITDIRLNDREVKVPFEGMIYKAVPGIPTSFLKQEENIIAVTWKFRVWNVYRDKKTNKTVRAPQVVMRAKDIPVKLLGLLPEDLAFHMGPVLGYAGTDFFTLTCRTTLIAQVQLKVDNKTYTSKPGLFHRFRTANLMPDTQYQYTLTARLPEKNKDITSIGPYTVRTMPGKGKLTFAVLGDSRWGSSQRNRDVWPKMTAAVAKAKPAFSVFNGDMVNRGQRLHEWDEQFLVAEEYLATIPFYAAIGDHEWYEGGKYERRDCPFFLDILSTPSGEENWHQEIGPILIIGIDGAMNWEKGGALAQWLENILVSSKAKFIFLASHFPTWTSAPHGKATDPGALYNKRGREVVMPLLKKYGATAMISGHDHVYERSEPPTGVTAIISGGGGATLRKKVSDAEKQNPYSKVFASKFHYCLFTVDDEICTMKVLTPEGEEIDTRTWKARTVR